MRNNTPTAIEPKATPRTRRRLSFSVESPERGDAPRSEPKLAHHYSTRHSEKIRRCRPPVDDDGCTTGNVQLVGTPSGRATRLPANHTPRRVHFEATDRDAPSQRIADALRFVWSLHLVSYSLAWAVSRIHERWSSIHGRLASGGRGRRWETTSLAARPRRRRRSFKLAMFVLIGLLCVLTGCLKPGAPAYRKAFSALLSIPDRGRVFSGNLMPRKLVSVFYSGFQRSGQLIARLGSVPVWLRQFSHHAKASMKGETIQTTRPRAISNFGSGLDWARHLSVFQRSTWRALWSASIASYHVLPGMHWYSEWLRHRAPARADSHWNELVHRIDRIEALLSEQLTRMENTSSSPWRGDDSQSQPDVETLLGYLRDNKAGALVELDNLQHVHVQQASAISTELRELRESLATVRTDAMQLVRNLETRFERLEGMLRRQRAHMHNSQWMSTAASDYALASAGARIIRAQPSWTRTFVSYWSNRVRCVLRAAFGSRAARNCHRPLPFAPAIMLQSQGLHAPLSRGRCWHVPRGSASVIVQLSEPICPATIMLLFSTSRASAHASFQNETPSVQVRYEALLSFRSPAMFTLQGTSTPNDCFGNSETRFCQVSLRVDPQVCVEPLSIVRVHFAQIGNERKYAEHLDKPSTKRRPLHAYPAVDLCIYKLAVLDFAQENPI
jgi:hypothetical protein